MQLKFKSFILVFTLISWWIPSAYAQSDISAGISNNKRSYFFKASYNQVWDALQVAMGAYPLDVNDKKNGLIKTQKLSANEIWRAPFESPPPSNYTQILIVEIFRIDRRTTQVLIEKKGQAQVDFVGSTESFSSSGWEELRLFYKAQRHIDMERVLRRIKVN